MVKKCLNFVEFYNKPTVSFFVVGMFLVSTDELLDLYCIHETDLKNKCFFIRVLKFKAVLLTLCHEI